MLLEINIRNFVLIESARIELGPGFTAITGETGAGKSLLVKALKMLMGAKADASVVRKGAKQAEIQALFSLPASNQHLLETVGLEADEELIIRRIIPREGRGRIYANGSLISAKNLKYLMKNLISLSGQHEYQDLLNRDRHRVLLDSFCGIEQELSSFQQQFHHMKKIAAELKEQRLNLRSREEEMARLQKEVEAISAIDPKEGEDTELEQRLQVLKAADKLRLLGEEAYRKLYGERGAILEVLADCRQLVTKMSELDHTLEQLLQELESSIYQLQDVAFGLRDYLGALDGDPAALNEVEERLYAIRQLKRKFGPEIEDVLQYRENSASRLEQLERLESDLADLQKALDESEYKVIEMAKRLCEKRLSGSSKLTKAVEQELEDLQLRKARFEVTFQIPDIPTIKDVSPQGMEKVEFVFAPNVGEELKPLASIASGGELSRVMLALKSILAAKAGMESMVFDEIDAGIGGEVAAKVGEKLRNLAQFGQVLAITHFPQIAALADTHIRVTKKIKDGSTFSEIKRLAGNERVDELKRMLGDEGEEAASFASRLLQESQRAGMSQDD